MRHGRSQDLLAEYLAHLDARLRSQRGKPTQDDQETDRAVLPDEIAQFCRARPRECLELILAALKSATTSAHIIAIGDELLENVLNENSDRVAAEVVRELRANRRFRQAFAFGSYDSVDPATLSEWVQVFQELGTTKDAERKSLRRGAV